MAARQNAPAFKRPPARRFGAATRRAVPFRRRILARSIRKLRARSRSQARRRPGRDVRTREGAALVRAATFRTNGQIGAALEQFVDAFEHLTAANRITVLLAPETLEAMRRAGERKSLVRSREYVIEAERKAARFASWYELFPRSQSAPGRSGTFRDTIERLPVLRDMGFDVLYLTTA